MTARRAPTSIFALPQLSLALLALAAPSQAADPESGGARAAWARLLPVAIEAGPQFGLTGSRLGATREYCALVEPTETVDRPWASPSWGAFASFRWRHGISLSVAPRRESYGLTTREETVSFPDNPFPHSLKARTELTYNVWPVLVGLGWRTSRQHVQATIGAYTAYLVEGSVRWKVDGEDYANMPGGYAPAPSSGGWMVGTEYGVKAGPGRVLVGFEAQGSRSSLLHGLKGTVRAPAARASLGYSLPVYRR